MTKRLLLVASLVALSTGACGKSPKQKCEAMADAYVTNVFDKMMNMFGGLDKKAEGKDKEKAEKEKKDMEFMREATKGVTVGLCVNDKWSDEVVDCLTTATLETAEKCMDKLTPEQKKSAEDFGGFGGARKKDEPAADKK